MAQLGRSLLFVPGSRPERFAKAAQSGADVICIDLEDACLPAEKNAAREAALDFMVTYSGPAQLVLRINSPRTAFGIQDLAAILTHNNPGKLWLMIPKVGTATDIQLIDSALAELDIALIALVESAEGLLNAASIAGASPRLTALMFGGGDLSAELGATLTWEPMLYGRSKLVVAAKLYQLELIDVPYLDIKDELGLAEEALRIRNLGYTCKAAIHPVQIAAINSAFTPSALEISRAEKIVTAYQAHSGGALLVDGRMIDLPLVVAAQRTVAMAKQLGIHSPAG